MNQDRRYWSWNGRRRKPSNERYLILRLHYIHSCNLLLHDLFQMLQFTFLQRKLSRSSRNINNTKQQQFLPVITCLPDICVISLWNIIFIVECHSWKQEFHELSNNISKLKDLVKMLFDKHNTKMNNRYLFNQIYHPIMQLMNFDYCLLHQQRPSPLDINGKMCVWTIHFFTFGE